MATLDFDKYNQKVEQWGKDTKSAFQTKAQAMGVVHRSDSPSIGSSIKRLQERFKSKDGTINTVSYRFRRSLVFAHKGAGKGRAGNVGSKWTDRYGKTQTTNPASKGKMATAGRKEKPFFNEVLDGPEGIDNLATIAAEELGDTFVSNMLLK